MVSIQTKNICMLVAYILAAILGYFSYFLDTHPQEYNFYFLMTLLSTVGFGDLSPTRSASRVLAACAMLCLVVANILGSWDGELSLSNMKS